MRGFNVHVFDSVFHMCILLKVISRAVRMSSFYKLTYFKPGFFINAVNFPADLIISNKNTKPESKLPQILIRKQQ